MIVVSQLGKSLSRVQCTDGAALSGIEHATRALWVHLGLKYTQLEPYQMSTPHAPRPLILRLRSVNGSFARRKKTLQARRLRLTKSEIADPSGFASVDLAHSSLAAASAIPACSHLPLCFKWRFLSHSANRYYLRVEQPCDSLPLAAGPWITTVKDLIRLLQHVKSRQRDPLFESGETH